MAALTNSKSHSVARTNRAEASPSMPRRTDQSTAPPIPIPVPSAWMRETTGKATLIAERPASPTLCPTKNPSTIA